MNFPPLRLLLARPALLLAMCLAGRSAVAAAPVDADPAAALRAHYASLGRLLEQNAFQQHLYLESAEGPASSQGDAYAVIDYPLSTLSAAFTDPAHWCEALILHLNVKYCHAGLRDQHPVVSVAIGRKYDQPVDSAFRFEFDYAVAPARADYLRIDLTAGHGPLATSNYRIGLEAVSLAPDRTFVHLRYSYAYGMEARVAMRAYLATTGSDKVGFTVVHDASHPQPAYVGGVRGAVERNTMRYYLAIEAYLGSLAAPTGERVEQSLERWFTATERYPRQLHEVDRATYVAMKRREYARQQTAQ